MNIKDFSKRIGVSPHTLRYYEKIGLLKNVRRNASRHRVYGDNDLAWMGFVKRLKETAMPLEQIQVYARLREQGASTRGQRQQLLEQHRDHLQAYIDQQSQHLTALNEKIDSYNSGDVR